MGELFAMIWNMDEARGLAWYCSPLTFFRAFAERSSRCIGTWHRPDHRVGLLLTLVLGSAQWLSAFLLLGMLVADAFIAAQRTKDIPGVLHVTMRSSM